MKKILLPILLIISTILFTQVFGYSNEKVGDTACSEIKNETRYPNLSPVLIGKIDEIGDKLNNKYKEKDEIYKDKIYELYIKLLNENIVKIKYSERQKEILLRIGDYFVCKKEELNNLDFVEGMLDGAEIDEATNNSTNNSTETNTEISNIKLSNITDHSTKVTWEGNSEATTWLYVKKTGKTGSKHDAKNNTYLYPSLTSGYEFILHIQGKGENKIHKIDFKTLAKNGTTNTTETPINSTPTTPVSSTDTTTGENKYLEEVNLPECDENNPEVFFIKTNDDWKHINDSDKRIFCVSPGNYKSLKNIKLTKSGTADKRRYIILNNGNDIHPGKLKTSDIAQFGLTFDGASYWTIDRASYLTPGNIGNVYELYNNSTHNIVNRAFTYNIGRSVRIIESSHNNTIQNSRFDTMSDNSRRSDMTAIELVPSYSLREIKNTKIINNEIVNANDAFQMVSYLADNGIELNGEGTIIDSNHMYITSAIYTDGKGNYSKNGKFTYAENAIDLKFGSSNPDNPVVITNNHFWGYRKADSTNSNLSAHGTALGMHYGVYNVKIKNNVFFDSSIGVGGGDSKGFRWSQKNLYVTKNLFYDIGPHLSYMDHGTNQPNGTKNLVFEDNDVIKSRGEYFKVSYCEDVSFKNNTIIDYDEPLLKKYISGTSVFSPNKIYKTTSEAGYTKDYTFTTDKFTNNPREIRLENVLKGEGNSSDVGLDSNPNSSINQTNDKIEQSCDSFDSCRIKPYSSNKWFWQYNGKPLLLLGGSSDDNLFQTTGKSLTNELDLIKSVGGNYIRNTMSDSNEGNLKAFYKRNDGKYDLLKWNDKYWEQFEFLLIEAEKRDIIVQIEVWDRFDHSRGPWIKDPYHPDNNINYTNSKSGFADTYPNHPGKNEQPFFYTVPELNNNKVVLPYQQKFIDKMLSYSLKYKNVLYTMDNETGADPKWGEYWANYIKNKADNIGKKVELTEMWDSWSLTSSSHHKYTWNNPSLYSYTDISQNNHNEGDVHWDNIKFVKNHLKNNPRPINNVKIYGYNSRFGTAKDGVNRFWLNVLGGTASARFHRPGAGDYGLGILEIAQNQIKAARKMESLINIQNNISTTSLLTSRSVDEAYLSYEKGKSYVVYFYKYGNIKLNISNDSGDFELRWLNLDTGDWYGNSEEKNILDSISLTTPKSNTYGWLAVLIKK